MALFIFLLCTYQETHFPISNWHSLLHNVSNWLIRYQRWSSLCKCRLNNSYRSVREREKGHFRNQLARPLTMNNWSRLIKICRDYPLPPQQIKHHTCVCCLFTYCPLSLLPLSQTSFSSPHAVTDTHCLWWNVRHFRIVAVSYCFDSFMCIHRHAQAEFCSLNAAFVFRKQYCCCSPCPWWKIQLIYALTAIPNIISWLAAGEVLKNTSSPLLPSGSRFWDSHRLGLKHNCNCNRHTVWYTVILEDSVLPAEPPWASCLHLLHI